MSMVSLLLTLPLYHILLDVKYVKIWALFHPYSIVYEIGQNTDTILSIFGKIGIRESPYLGIFHAVQLWCFYCWLWTCSCHPRCCSYHIWLLFITKPGRKKETWLVEQIANWNIFRAEYRHPLQSPTHLEYWAVTFVLCPYICPGHINENLQVLKYIQYYAKAYSGIFKMLPAISRTLNPVYLGILRHIQ